MSVQKIYFLAMSAIQYFLSLYRPDESSMLVLHDDPSLIKFIDKILPDQKKVIVPQIPLRHLTEKELFEQQINQFKNFRGQHKNIFENIDSTTQAFIFSLSNAVHYFILIGLLRNKGVNIKYIDGHPNDFAIPIDVSSLPLIYQTHLSQLSKIAGDALTLYQHRLWVDIGMAESPPKIEYSPQAWNKISEKYYWDFKQSCKGTTLLIDGPVHSYPGVNVSETQKNVVKFIKRLLNNGKIIHLKPHYQDELKFNSLSGTELENQIKILPQFFPAELIIGQYSEIYGFTSRSLIADVTGKKYSLMNLLVFESQEAKKTLWKVFRETLKGKSLMMPTNEGPIQIMDPIPNSNPTPPEKAADNSCPLRSNLMESSQFQPLRFLQINTFYQKYLIDFYKEDQKLAFRPADEQTQRILADGFSAIHNFTPSIRQLGYTSKFIIANCQPALFQWLNEKGLQFESQQNWFLEITKKQIEDFKPDILFLSDAFIFDRQFIRKLSFRPKLVIGWTGESLPAGLDWSDFDIILSNFNFSRKRALEYGAKATEHFYPGFVDWLANESKAIKPIYDVVFVGQWSALHQKRNQIIYALAKAAERNQGFRLGLYLLGEKHKMPPEVQAFCCGERFDLAMHQALRSGKIAINAGILPEAGNMRLFEATGTGVFLLTEYQNNIKDYFLPGKEIETFKDNEELIEKIHYYLEHPKKREAIARRGQERCLSDHSMEKRIIELDKIIRKHLPMRLSSVQTPGLSQSLAIHQQDHKYNDEVIYAEANLDNVKSVAQQKRFGHFIVDYNGMRIHCHDLLSFYMAAKDIFLQKIYDFSTQSSCPKIIDGSGHIGLFTMFAKHKYPNAKITVFEPDSCSLEYLKKNIVSNHLQGIQIVEAGLYNESGEMPFNSDQSDGSSMYGADGNNSIQTVRLSDYITSEIDFLKLNIEGAELDVISEIAPKLHLIKEVAIEYHGFPETGQNLHKILDYLDLAGFRYMIHDFDRMTNPATKPPYQLETKSRFFLLIYGKKLFQSIISDVASQHDAKRNFALEPMDYIPDSWSFLSNKYSWKLKKVSNDTILLIDAPIQVFPGVNTEKTLPNMIAFLSKLLHQGKKIHLKPHSGERFNFNSLSGTHLEKKVKVLPKYFPAELIMPQYSEIYTFLTSATMNSSVSGRKYSLGKLASFDSKEAEKNFWKLFQDTIGENSKIIHLNHEVLEIVHNEMPHIECNEMKKAHNGNPLKAVKNLQHAEDGSKNRAQVIDLNRKGEDLYSRGDLQSALTIFESAIELDPKSTTAHNNLGVLFWEKGESQKGIQYFSNALKIDPNDKVSVLNLGDAWEDLGESNKAIDLYRSYLRMNPNDSEILAKREGLKNKEGRGIIEKNKLRFLQIHSFYENYLLDLYKKNPGLLNVSYFDHISALFNDAFSGAHLFAPYLRNHGYQDLLIIGNCIPSQSQWAKENNLNAAISNLDQLIDIARMQVEVFKPHILYLSHPVGWLDSRFVESLAWKPSLVVGWRGAPSPVGTDWSKFDLILSHLTACKKYALEVGAQNVEHFYPGFPRFIADKVREVPKQYDIVFSGQWSSLHRQRNEFIKQVAEAPFVQDGTYSVGFFILASPGVLPECVEKFNHGPRWGIDMHRVLKSGRVVINAEIDMGRGDAGNMRLFETTGTGSFMLTEYHKNIHRYFEPRIEIETFRDSTEMLAKIKYYLEHPEEREAIARKGQARCMNQYSMKIRTAEFDQIIQKNLNDKINGHKPEPTSWGPRSNTLKEDIPRRNKIESEEVLNIR